MKKSVGVILVAILLGLLAAGVWADCQDETNPQCFVCRQVFIWSYCGIVTGGDTGYCDCQNLGDGMNRFCLSEGEFCGMIIVVG